MVISSGVIADLHADEVPNRARHVITLVNRHPDVDDGGQPPAYLPLSRCQH
jgi:hypothetical protein